MICLMECEDSCGYEGDVFKPLQEIDLCEGTKAFLVLKPERIAMIVFDFQFSLTFPYLNL